jgi:hypothetical protein
LHPFFNNTAFLIIKTGGLHEVIQIFKSSNLQIFKSSNLQIFKSLNLQIQINCFMLAMIFAFFSGCDDSRVTTRNTGLIALLSLKTTSAERAATIERTIGAVSQRLINEGTAVIVEDNDVSSAGARSLAATDASMKYIAPAPGVDYTTIQNELFSELKKALGPDWETSLLAYVKEKGLTGITPENLPEKAKSFLIKNTDGITQQAVKTVPWINHYYNNLAGWIQASAF